jgi:glycosyltransferase 2 family protein
MFRVLYPIAWTEATRCARRLPELPRARLIVAARWLVTILALWLVLRSIDIGTVLDLIARAGLTDLGLAGLATGVQFALLVWRWQLIIRMLGGETVSAGALSVFLGHSMLIGQGLPSSVGGDVARSVMLARLTGASAAIRSVVCDRLLGFAGLALLAFPTFPIIAGKMGDLAPFLALAIAALGTIAAVALIAAAPSIIHAVPSLGRFLGTVAEDLRLVLCSGKVSLVVVALSAGSHLLSVLLIYIFGLAISANLRLLDCLVLVPPALLALVLPISLAGWGVREGALVAAFSLVHADPAAVAATSVMLGLTTPLAGVAVAATSLFIGINNIPAGGSRDGG